MKTAHALLLGLLSLGATPRAMAQVTTAPWAVLRRLPLLGAPSVPGPSAPPPRASRPDREDKEASVDSRVQRNACGGTFPRQPVATLRWAARKDTRLKALPQQHLDATVYKKGFDEGTFVSVQPSAKPTAGAFKMMAKRAPTAPKLPAALTKLRTMAPAKNDVRLRAVVTAEQPAVLVGGLEPGVNYFWRVTSGTASSGVVRCQAPICPADVERSPEPKRSAARDASGRGRCVPLPSWRWYPPEARGGRRARRSR